MNSDTLKYLQQDAIGKVIAKGLADVYTNKPQTPVKYLAAWLKKYSLNQQKIVMLSNYESLKATRLNQYNENAKATQKKAVETKQREAKSCGQLQAFKNKVQNDEYQKQLLFSELPEFIEKRCGLTGCYIGYVKNPPKAVTDEDEDQNAHLDTNQPKMINYIGSSKSHSELMLNQTLALDKGVTGGAFALSLDDPVPAEDGTVQVKDKYVYIGNVVKNQNMHYFRLPKLGAYIAIPLVYNSYLTESIFDAALEAKQKYLDELQQFEKQKGEALKEIEAEIEAATQKLEDAKEKNDQAAIETAQGELDQAQKKKKQKEEEHIDEEEPELPTEKKQFVVCGDTMGQDCEISAEKRQMLLQLVKHFRDSWQKKEKELLYKDVNYQVNIRKDQTKNAQEVIEHLEKCIEIPAQTKTTFDEIEDQQLRQYKKQTWQLDALKKEIKQGQGYLADFFKLKNFRVVKFRGLIQTLLYFLQYPKSKINQEGKTRLDWKRVRANYLFADTFNCFLNYNTEGPKKQEYPFYSKLQYISEGLQKYAEADVYKYNIGLGALLTLTKKLIAHRTANIELRRSQKEKERQQRNVLIEENNKITEQKQQALEKHKQSLSGEDAEAFKEEDWSAEYDKENPLKEIPPEVVDDVDNDF